jgi:addiction module RelE/StbE family toxin
MRVVLAPRAMRDLRKIAAYLRDHNPVAADAAITGIVKSIENLAQFPLLGRSIEARKVRRLSIPGSNYIAYYRLSGGDVIIFHVCDDRRKPYTS